MTLPTNVTVARIVQRMGTDPRNGLPAPNTEIFYVFERDGVQHHALTRVPWAVADTPFQRDYEREQFLRRARASQ